MIGIHCTITRSGEVVHEQTIAYDGSEIESISKAFTVNHEPIEVAITFDPPVLTEISIEG